MAVDPEQEAGPVTVALEVSVQGWESSPVHYANHVQATFNGTDFVLTFSQALVPPVSDVRQLEGLTAPVLMRIVVPAAKFTEAMAAFVQLLNKLEARGLLADSCARWERTS